MHFFFHKFLAVLSFFGFVCHASVDPEAKSVDTFQARCEDIYVGNLQGPLKEICIGSRELVQKSGLRLAQTSCRLQYGEELRSLQSCLFGTLIANANQQNDEKLRSTLKAQTRLCMLHYPEHTDVDGFLLEGCLGGIAMNEMSYGMNDIKGRTLFEKISLCKAWTPERSFIGPCTAGLTLREQIEPARLSLPVASSLNLQCDRFFDHRKFHLGYRSCLNSVAVSLPQKMSMSTSSECQQIVSDTANENERAACIVGASLRSIDSDSHPLLKRYESCGKESKVSYEDRDFLACLTAASFMQFMEPPAAAAACKEVFRAAKKGTTRQVCLNSLKQI